MATVLWCKLVILQTWYCNLGLPFVFWCGLPLQLQMGHQHGARHKHIHNHIPNKTIPQCRQDELTVSQHTRILHLHQPLHLHVHWDSVLQCCKVPANQDAAT